MPRRKVAFLPGHYYHLYNRGNNRQNIFFDREHYLFFLRQFRHHVAAEAADVIAYCLMPNHYHFLVYLREDSLSEKMGYLSLSYTKAINKRCQRSGGLFQGPFQAIHVDAEAYLLNLSRYIHLNPVKAGLVQRPEDWEFSSYQEYVERRRGTLPHYRGLQQQAGGATAYQAFVESESVLMPAALQSLMLDE
ncbi:REP-associated tyrosine transposase [Leptolyngbya sp. KIOST-1]|uniref:REP-associated tyrosine transposase n=1 Tax=Leptolyngbya sp. KIOST-1 TaxID=1229172 RepID=UPI000566DCBC|nr:transposase [Leptolyngbya sp. KIOST-1]